MRFLFRSTNRTAAFARAFVVKGELLRDSEELAREVVARCRALARHSEDIDVIRRTFLSAPMRDCHREIAGWVAPLGITSRVDAVGNLRMIYPGAKSDARRLLIGSHLRTVA